MDIVGLIVNLVSGGVGGNATGVALKDKSLGVIGNTIAGMIGGAAGGYIIQAVGLLNTLGLGNSTASSLVGDASAALVSGGVVTAIIGIIKKAMGK